MTCSHAVHPRLVEMAVLNNPSVPMKDYRCYRIEYGFECSCPEGSIWLPPLIDPETVERMLQRLVREASIH